MDSKEIAERLITIHSALVEKLGEQPYFAPSFSVRQSGEAFVDLYRAGKMSILHTAKGKTISATLDDADAFIAGMPDSGETQKREFHKDLGRLIDRGRKIDIEPAVMAPLTAGMEVLSENLLTHSKE